MQTGTPMLHLHTFKPCLGILSPSPFAVKADALLAMSGLPYERKYEKVQKAPRGKFPVLVDGNRVIPDSAHIQSYLETEKGIEFDALLMPEQIAEAEAFRRMIENHFYFINGHFRWTEHPDAIRESYFGDVPAVMRNLVFKIVLRTVNKTNHLQGISRHTRDEIINFARQDINAIATYLGDKQFFLGDRPTSIDASLYGAMENLINCELEIPTKPIAAGYQNLVDYCDRFRDTVFGAK